ncbi:MAG TPA: MurT ligase domain-containing protein [Acidimicrobiales bacterium]|nr:MurT ligase domain-containing protein [Acidimicrobiales bacterium]
MDLPLRTRVAVAAGKLVSEVSRRVGTGQGSAIGGKVTLALDPSALALLAGGRDVALVSGTNGKTTTTRLLAAALATRGPVTTNSAGANLLSGLTGALSAGAGGTTAGVVGDGVPAAALEVDEGLLAKAVNAVHPQVVALLNLSRDQLDRIGEVRLHAEAWRRALDAAPDVAVVANADDPLVAWAASGGRRVTWVATGQRWRSDAGACPACGGRIRWTTSEVEGTVWSCSGCGFARPRPDVEIEGENLVLVDGRRVPVLLQLPGRFNVANAAMAAGAAAVLGVEPDVAAKAMAEVETVAGRYQVVVVDGVKVRLLLAKNPAGWAETLDLIRPPPMPAVVGINARIADGRDPSWLWDVPFERLRGRLVIATGERGRDLAVRLRYAEVEHRFVAHYREAVRAAGAPDIDLAANYTSFQDARRALAPRDGSRG